MPAASARPSPLPDGPDLLDGMPVARPLDAESSIEFRANAAISDSWRIARPGADRRFIEGVPGGLSLDVDAITRDLARRQRGYGRGRRMAIEPDRARDPLRRSRWRDARQPDRADDREPRLDQLAAHDERRRPSPPSRAGGARRAPVTRPRPGHADLAGGLKYDRDDLRDILERASARETAAARRRRRRRARQLLAHVGIEVTSHVFAIGGVGLADPHAVTFDACARAARRRRRCAAPTRRRGAR